MEVDNFGWLVIGIVIGAILQAAGTYYIWWLNGCRFEIKIGKKWHLLP